MISVFFAVSLLPALAGGVPFEDSARVGETRLVLQGADVMRWRRVVDVYAAAFYLEDAITGTGRALEDVPRRLELHYFVSIPAKGFAKATREYFQKNAGPGEVESLAADLETFTALYKDVKPGDRYALTYLPGRGTELSLNGTALGSVSGEAFSKALFGIWIGAEPIDAGVRKNLLRGPKT